MSKPEIPVYTIINIIDNFRDACAFRDPDIYYGLRVSEAVYTVK